jgi:hypothetical protein
MAENKGLNISFRLPFPGLIPHTEVRRIRMAFDRDKFKALVQYVCWLCKDDPATLGAVKLNKILWLSDFVRYYETGEAITGARYVKRQYGPVPRAIVPVLEELEAEQKVFSKDVHFHGYLKKEFTVVEEPTIDVFTKEELDVVNRIAETVRQEHTAKSISRASHDHIWHVAEDGEEIPYFTIFAVPGEIGEDEREWARLELEGSAV